MNNIDVAQRIKKKCKENNITINQLSDKCELSKGFIYELEKRNKSLSSDRIFRIAKFLNCSADYLLGLEYTEESTEQNSKKLTFENENQAEMFDIFNKLTEDYQKKAISQVFDLLIEMCRKQDEELNSKKAYIAAFGGGVFEIDDETAKFIEENAVFEEYNPKNYKN